MKRFVLAASTTISCLFATHSAQAAPLKGDPAPAAGTVSIRRVFDGIRNSQSLQGLRRATTASDIGGVLFVPWDINNRGQITVVHSVGNDFLAREGRWERGVITDLGVSVGGAGEHSYINERGQIATTNVCDPPLARAVSWDGALQDRSDCLSQPSIVGMNESGAVLVNSDNGARFFGHGNLTVPGMDLATGLNNRGQVVGEIDHFDPVTFELTSSEGALWQAGKTIKLGTSATAINDRGQVGGVQGSHAFLWDHGVMTDLGGVAGMLPVPVSINERGQVAIFAFPLPEPTVAMHALLWDHGNLKDLGKLPGDDESTAILVNNRGEVLGNSYQDVPPNAHHAFVWRDGVMKSLGSLGGRDTYVFDMNDLGQAVGISQTAAGERHAFLWENGVMTDLSKITRFADSTASRGHGHGRGRIDAPLDAAQGQVSASDWTTNSVGTLPLQFGLRNIVPNPMIRATRIEYELPSAGPAELAIHDASGRLVRTLAQSEFAAGRHSVSWDGRNASGALVRPGVYLARLTALGKSLSSKLIVLP